MADREPRSTPIYNRDTDELNIDNVIKKLLKGNLLMSTNKSAIKLFCVNISVILEIVLNLW